MNRRKMKQWKQLIAAMLAITLLATSADLQLLAAPAEETATEESRVDDETVEKPEAAGPKESFALSGDDPQILSEVEEKREESSKTFLMSDGTFMVAQYAAPVHYEDAEGEWQEIDHSLELETTETAEVYTTTEKA